MRVAVCIEHAFYGTGFLMDITLCPLRTLVLETMSALATAPAAGGGPPGHRVRVDSTRGGHSYSGAPVTSEMSGCASLATPLGSAHPNHRRRRRRPVATTATMLSGNRIPRSNYGLATLGVPDARRTQVLPGAQSETGGDAVSFSERHSLGFLIRDSALLSISVSVGRGGLATWIRSQDQLLEPGAVSGR